MTHEDTLRTDLQTLLGSQRLAVLSTHDQGQPYASLVAFAATGDLGRILFATARTTRKFHNMANDARVALLVDDRSNTERDFHQATAVTVIGISREIPPGQAIEGRDLYLSKHPYLEGFLNSETCALVEVRVEKYLVVNRFQNVFELRVGL
jgi:heme iron utilization protein